MAIDSRFGIDLADTNSPDFDPASYFTALHPDAAKHPNAPIWCRVEFLQRLSGNVRAMTCKYSGHHRRTLNQKLVEYPLTLVFTFPGMPYGVQEVLFKDILIINQCPPRAEPSLPRIISTFDPLYGYDPSGEGGRWHHRQAQKLRALSSRP